MFRRTRIGRRVAALSFPDMHPLPPEGTPPNQCVPLPHTNICRGGGGQGPLSCCGWAMMGGCGIGDGSCLGTGGSAQPLYLPSLLRLLPGIRLGPPPEGSSARVLSHPCAHAWARHAGHRHGQMGASGPLPGPRLAGCRRLDWDLGARTRFSPCIARTGQVLGIQRPNSMEALASYFCRAFPSP